MFDNRRLLPAQMFQSARFGFFAHALSCQMVALLVPGSLHSWLWPLSVLASIGSWVAFSALQSHQVSMWGRRAAAVVALVTGLPQVVYYLHSGGPETAAALSAPYLLLGAVTAMVLLPARIDPAPESVSESPRQAAIAAVTHVLTGLLALLAVVASFLHGADSAWWMIGFTTLMWCSSVSRALIRAGRDCAATGAAAFCGALHLPAVVFWFNPFLGVGRADLLALVTVGLYALIVTVCLYLSTPPPVFDPPAGKPPLTRDPRPNGARRPSWPVPTRYGPARPVPPFETQSLIRGDPTP